MMHHKREPLGKNPLFEKESIARGVRELAAELTEEYNGGEVILLGVMDGCFIFVSDLARALPLPMRIGFVSVKSYTGARVNRNNMRVNTDCGLELAGQNVLLADTVLDTGNTLQTLYRKLSEKNPASLKSCVLVDKTPRRDHSITPDYRGFILNRDEFIVGYGLDYKGRFRNLPHIYALKKTAL